MPKNVVGRADHAAPTQEDPIMARIRKFLAALAGVAAMVVSTGVLEETEEIWVNAGLALLTALGVYAVPNDRTSRGAHDPHTRP